MKFSKILFQLLVVVGFASFLAKAQADEVVISDFNNFSLTGTYVQWDGGTFTSNPTNFRVQANDFGGGFFNLASPLDGGTNDALRLVFEVNQDNVADKMNVVLVDGDGTERVFRFDNLSVGTQNRTVLLTDFLQDNAPGSTPGLDISNITTFHLQGTFENGDPGLLMDKTFSQLSLITIPEPSTGLLAVCGLIGLMARRKR